MYRSEMMTTDVMGLGCSFTSIYLICFSTELPPERSVLYLAVSCHWVCWFGFSSCVITEWICSMNWSGPKPHSICTGLLVKTIWHWDLHFLLSHRSTFGITEIPSLHLLGRVQWSAIAKMPKGASACLFFLSHLFQQRSSLLDWIQLVRN